MDFCRYQCVYNGSIDVSNGAKKFLDQHNSSFQLNQAGYITDLIKIKGAMFTYWNGFVSTPTKGCLQSLCQYVKQNADIQVEWENAIENDVKYWLDSKVYGDFYVLFERRDGTIMIEKKTKKVYLVVGMAQSIGELFKSSKLCWNTTPFQDLYFHGSLIGLIVNTTLINFDGKITYDGCVLGKSNSKATNFKRLIKLYIAAADRGEIISSLPKVIKNTTVIAKAVKESFSEVTKKILKQLVNIPSELNMGIVSMLEPKERSELKTLAMEEDSYFVFRRHGYTEETNPEHLVTVMTSSQGALVAMIPTVNLIPSVEEYIYILSLGISNYRSQKKPLLILIDALEQVDHFREVLLDHGINIMVEWYPPPSAGNNIIILSITYTYIYYFNRGREIFLKP
jgi:hypothetical protein